MDEFVVGIDCGASHSSMAIWKDGKKVIYKGDLPGVNLDLVDSSEAMERLVPAVKEVSQCGNGKWVVGMAGIDSEEERKEANSWMRELLRLTDIHYSGFVVFSDIDLVLWAGGNNGAGIALIAGTGSNCLGRNKFGETHKAGGMSHILSDEGGGFALGWNCLHLATKMNDGRAEPTELLNEVLATYSVSNIAELKNVLTKDKNMKVLVARSAELLLAAADRGEEEALKICAEQSLELVRMIAAVNAALPTEEILPVFLAGSIFRNKNYLDLFTSGLQKYSPSQKANLVSPIDGCYAFATSVR